MAMPRNPRDVEVLALIPARGGSKGRPGRIYSPSPGSRRSRIPSSRRWPAATSGALWSPPIRRRSPTSPGGTVPRCLSSGRAGMRRISPDIDAFRHALDHLLGSEGYRCDYVVHLRPPTVLRSVEDIDEAIELIVSDPEADTLRSVSAAELFLRTRCGFRRTATWSRCSNTRTSPSRSPCRGNCFPRCTGRTATWISSVPTSSGQAGCPETGSSRTRSRRRCPSWITWRTSRGWRGWIAAHGTTLGPRRLQRAERHSV